MTFTRTRPFRNGRTARHVRSVLVLVATVTVVSSCSSNSAAPESTASSTSTGETTAPTVGTPSTEAVPSLAPETEETTQPTTTSSQPTIEVKGPSLGANFSGVGDWHIHQDPALADITVFTQGSAEAVDISYGIYGTDAADGLSYTGGQIDPSGTHFQLRSDNCAGPVPASHEDVNGTCADLVFDPSAGAGAPDPFTATLVLRLQLTCSGQDNPTCRQTPEAQSAGPAAPVTLTFTQSVALHGSAGCDPAPNVDPPCATGSAVSAVVSEPPEDSADSAAPSSSPIPTG